VVVVSVLSTEGDGTASAELLATVDKALSADDKRPVADRLTVQAAEIVNYQINALLYFYPALSLNLSIPPRRTRFSPG
jgi:phage-related baseplate assembly protein